MSELTQCNYCSLNALRARAKREKKRVTIMRGRRYADKGWRVPARMRGFDVYVHPLWIDLHDEQWTTSKRQRYWVCWYWELSDHCVC
jgi:hypothetical protein